MKDHTFKWIISIVLFLPTVLSSCKKDEIDNSDPKQEDNTIENIGDYTLEMSPYIAGAVAYVPAFGQFVNAPNHPISFIHKGDNYEKVLEECSKRLTDPTQASGITLGGLGGFVIFRFDHKVINAEGSDFKIKGNGGNECGVVWVSQEGEEWFQIKGEVFGDEIRATEVSYLPTYTADGQLTQYDKDDLSSIACEVFINGAKSIVDHVFNEYHQNVPYMPWCFDYNSTFHNNHYSIEDGKLIFHNVSQVPAHYVNQNVDGYVDGKPGDLKVDLSDAVDKDGKNVDLDYIQYVKIQCAIDTIRGVMGEASTEVYGATDIHCLEYQEAVKKKR